MFEKVIGGGNRTVTAAIVSILAGYLGGERLTFCEQIQDVLCEYSMCEKP